MVSKFDCQRTYPNAIKVYQNKPFFTQNLYYPEKPQVLSDHVRKYTTERSVSGIRKKVDHFPIWIIATAREEGTLTTLDYVVPNPAIKVLKLLSNIRSNNPALITSITNVQT